MRSYIHSRGKSSHQRTEKMHSKWAWEKPGKESHHYNIVVLGYKAWWNRQDDGPKIFLLFKLARHEADLMHAWNKGHGGKDGPIISSYAGSFVHTSVLHIAFSFV